MIQEERVGNRDRDGATPSIVRSFVMTGGRATPKVELGFETLVRVRTQAKHRMWPVGPKGDIVAVCDGRSVAEVSAKLSLPLGVVRVLLGDLVAEGHVEAERSITRDTSLVDRRELLERTLRGLRTG